MKQLSLRFAAVLALLVCASRLSADPIIFELDGGELLGTIDHATPANATNAAAQVNYLVSYYNVPTPNNTVLPDNDYTLFRPAGAPAMLASVTLATTFAGPNVGGVNPASINLGGFKYDYALFFQASDAWVYYIGNISPNDAIHWSGSASNPGLSHYYLFNRSEPTPTQHRVPDGGTTVLLVGAGLLLTAFAARRKKSA